MSSSDPAIALAFAIAAGALALSLLLLAAIVVMRAWRRYRAASLDPRRERWRDALHVAVDDPAAARLPPVSSLDLPELLRLFNHFQESLRGDAARNLAQALRANGINARVVAMLRSRSTRRRLIAITAIGHLRDPDAWESLSRLAHERDPVVSFAAARALLRIQPAGALDEVGAALVARSDWALARIATIFQELGADVVTPCLERWMRSRPHPGLDRAVCLARFGHRERLERLVRGCAITERDPGVLVALLDFLEGGEDLDWIRRQAAHEDARVRMAAARAFGRVGGRAELDALATLLCDRSWWVRYHAGRAIARLHGVTASEIATFARRVEDRFARDMLAQAMAEAAR